MKVLITGASGLLGKYLISTSNPNDSIIAISRSVKRPSQSQNTSWMTFDLGQTKEISNFFEQVKPDVVIHAAGEARVDFVETHEKDSYEINVSSTRELANVAKIFGCPFVYVSSNAVFGKLPPPYFENSPFSPMNKYGEQKVQAEKAVSEICDRHIIARPILMYGWPNTGQRDNPMSMWVSQLRSGLEISVVDDIMTQPLSAIDCAKSIWAAVGRNFQGSYLISGGEVVSLYEFAIKVARIFEFDSRLVKRIKSTELKNLAPRPTSTYFDLTCLNEKLGIYPSNLDEGLGSFRDQERFTQNV
jgi:dTDP-4-dehydrorhamnose reductase